MPSDKMLSVAECFELPAGDDQNASWVNPGVRGVIRSSETRRTKTGKTMWPCELADETGSAVIAFTMWTAPKFKEGDVVEIFGKGLRRTEFNHNAQITLGKETEVHVIGQSVHHEEQRERAATGQPALNGSLQPFAGQSVGCSLNNAHEMMRFIYSPEEMKAMLADGSYWSRIWKFTSRHLEVARELEQGKLAKGPADKAAAAAPPPPDRSPATGTGAGTARQPASRGQPQDERQAANLSEPGQPTEDVPW